MPWRLALDDGTEWLIEAQRWQSDQSGWLEFNIYKGEKRRRRDAITVLSVRLDRVLWVREEGVGTVTKLSPPGDPQATSRSD